ncbi:MAG: hypothetical protein AB7T06_42655 [Kofleriaceae bacterium]
MLYSPPMGIDVTHVIEQLAAAGLDVVHPFDAHAIGRLARAEAEREARRPLAAWARLENGPRLGLLVGNTRALWPHFVAARGSLPELDPLDTYVERTIVHAIERTIDHEIASSASSVRVATGPTSIPAITSGARTVVYAHRRYDGAFLPFQPLAIACGLAAMSDAGLAVHPTYGPWFALRAVITLDAPSFAIPAAAPIAKPCACTGACEAALAHARDHTGDWRAWLAVRDACSMRAYRYSDEQIRFHYASAWPAARE